MTDPYVPHDRSDDSSAVPGGGTPGPLPESLAGPLSPVLPYPGRPLGLRAAAALIDIALLIALFVIVGLVAGEPSSAALPPGQMILSVGHVGGGLWWLTFGRATVAGWWLALYLALVLLYYFALEVTTGQTAGKRLAGLRVVRADGGRPSAAAVAGRTLLRLIDWLPLLYLVGFISVLATGQRRERLGDLAAGTRVMRARPAPRGLPAAALAVAALAVLGLSVRVTSGGSTRSCQAPVAAAGGTLTYRAHCVSFDYPAGWQQVRPSVSESAGSALWRTGIAIGPSDLILIAAYPQHPAVTAANVSSIIPAVVRVLGHAIKQNGGVIQAGPEKITVGGLPALEFRATGHSFSGTAVGSTIVIAFAGAKYYEFDCQHTLAHAAEMERACDQVLRTFKAG